MTHSYSAAGQHTADAPTWLRVGCTHPVSMAFRVAMASMPPAAPRQCPIMDLVPFTFKCFVSGKADLTALISAMSPTRVEVACALM